MRLIGLGFLSHTFHVISLQNVFLTVVYKVKVISEKPGGAHCDESRMMRFEWEYQEAIPGSTPNPPISNQVGIDVGISSLISTSDGEKIPNPKHFNRLYQKLKFAQKEPR